MISFDLSWVQIGICLFWGFSLSVIYLALLWLTIKSLSKSKHRVFLLLISAIARLALFLTGAILLSQHQAARFLWIVVGFVITRLLLVGLVKTKGTV